MSRYFWFTLYIKMSTFWFSSWCVCHCWRRMIFCQTTPVFNKLQSWDRFSFIFSKIQHWKGNVIFIYTEIIFQKLNVWRIVKVVRSSLFFCCSRFKNLQDPVLGFPRFYDFSLLEASFSVCFCLHLLHLHSGSDRPRCVVAMMTINEQHWQQL